MAKLIFEGSLGGSVSHTAANKWFIEPMLDVVTALNGLTGGDSMQAKLTRILGNVNVVSYNTETGTYEFVPNYPLHMWVIVLMSQSAALPAESVYNASEVLRDALDNWVSDEYAYQVLGESNDDFKNFGIYGTDYLNVSQTKVRYQFTPRKNMEIVAPEAGSGSMGIKIYLVGRHSGNKSIVMYHRYLDTYKLEYTTSQRKMVLGSWQG